jgi:hypothetical protein
MGEARDNIAALMIKTLPSFPPNDRMHEVNIVGRVSPKRNVLLVREVDAREVDGEKQWRRSDEGAWEKVPAGSELHVLGKPLPPEKCDFVLVMLSSWLAPMRTRDEPVVGHQVLPGEVFRADYQEFLQKSEASIGQRPRLVVSA